MAGSSRNSAQRRPAGQACAAAGERNRIGAYAIGGENLGETAEGVACYPINLRDPRELRDSVDDLRRLPIITAAGQSLTLDTLASVSVERGLPMIKAKMRARRRRSMSPSSVATSAASSPTRSKRSPPRSVFLPAIRCRASPRRWSAARSVRRCCRCSCCQPAFRRWNAGGCGVDNCLRDSRSQIRMADSPAVTLILASGHGTGAATRHGDRTAPSRAPC